MSSEIESQLNESLKSIKKDSKALEDFINQTDGTVIDQYNNKFKCLRQIISDIDARIETLVQEEEKIFNVLKSQTQELKNETASLKDETETFKNEVNFQINSSLFPTGGDLTNNGGKFVKLNKNEDKYEFSNTATEFYGFKERNSELLLDTDVAEGDTFSVGTADSDYLFWHIEAVGLVYEEIDSNGHLVIKI